MKTLTIHFEGHEAEKIADELWHYFVDGGLEDQVIDTLSNDTREVEMSDFNKAYLALKFKGSSK